MGMLHLRPGKSPILATQPRPSTRRPPTPTSPILQTNPSQLSQKRRHFLQFNTNGIQNSQQQIHILLWEQDIMIACIQETNLTSTSSLSPFPNYTVIIKERSQGQGGRLITLVYHSVTYHEVNKHNFFLNDNNAEIRATTIEVDGVHLLVCNIYIPPTTSCTRGYTPNFSSLFTYDGDIIIMGDFKAQDASWYSS